MPQPCTVRCLWAGFSPCAAGSACGVCVSLYVCYVVSMDPCVFHETCSLVRAAWRADSLNVAIFMAACPASRASRWSRAARLRPQSAVVLARSLRATRGARPKRHDAEVHRCSSAGCAATLYNAPHAAIRLIRQGFGREERTLCARRHGVPRALAGDRCCGGRVASCIGRPGPVVFERTVPVEQTWPWRSEAAPAQGLEPAEPHADAASPSPSRLDARG